MKPQIQKLPLSEYSSFMTGTFVTPYFETPWHYHPEYEIVLIIEGRGKCFIGNHVSDYQVGDLCFLGPNLPHLFRKDDPDSKGGSLVIHFLEDFVGKEFVSIPEMQNIQLLFARSKMGIRFAGKARQVMSTIMKQMVQQQGMHRFISLLKLLSEMAACDEYELLSSPEITGQNTRDSDRLNKVFDHVMRNFKDDIGLRDVAALSNMSYSGFCRYFKNRTKKNFSHFVNEIRIGYACRRLMESDESVGNICYESGFNNMTNFTEQFKKIVRCTPHRFRRGVGSG